MDALVEPIVTPKRRDRYARTPRTTRIAITLRDIEIFRLLQRYRYLRTEQIYQLLPQDIRGPLNSKFRDRLTDLFNGYQLPGEPHVYWLGRPRGQKYAYNARYSPLIYELVDRGERTIASLGAKPQHVADLVRRGRAGANRQFPHA